MFQGLGWSTEHAKSNARLPDVWGFYFVNRRGVVDTTVILCYPGEILIVSNERQSPPSEYEEGLAKTSKAHDSAHST
jgi:hypothetical protein